MTNRHWPIEERGEQVENQEDNVHESVLDAARLVQELRRSKKWTQKEFATELGVSRQVVNRLEMGTNSKVDIVMLAKAAEVCGERLTLSSISKEVRGARPRTELELEYEIIIAFSKGELRRAEEYLNLIKKWIYPDHQLMARANREVGRALMYYFRGRPTRAISHVNQVVMGLGMCGFPEKAKEISDRFQRNVSYGKLAIENEILKMEISLAEEGMK
nr:helix-turn-helix transcriptional regulator [Vagococcus allomyrinae]